MTFFSAVGAFDSGTGIVGSTVVVSGLGFAPKLVLFWWSGRTESTDTAGAATHYRGFGAAVSATDRRCAASMSQNAAATMVAQHTQANDAVIYFFDNAGAVDGYLDVSSLDSDGFTLVVDDQLATSRRISYIAFGGSDITHVAGGDFTKQDTTGNQDITALAFQPDCVIFLAASRSTSNGRTILPDSVLMVGAATGSSNQAVWTGGSNNGSSNAQTVSYAYSAECFAALNTAVTLTEQRAAFVSFLSNGFRINWTENVAGAYRTNYVAIKGGKWIVGNLLTQTDTTTPIVENGFGFEPKGVLLVSHCNAESTVDTVQDDDEWSMGAFTGALSRIAQGMSDDDAAANGIVSTSIETDACYVNLNAATSAVEGLMDVQSVDGDGFKLIMDDADPSQAFVWYLAGGAPQMPEIPGKVRRQRRLPHYRM